MPSPLPPTLILAITSQALVWSTLLNATGYLWPAGTCCPNCATFESLVPDQAPWMRWQCEELRTPWCSASAAQQWLKYALSTLFWSQIQNIEPWRKPMSIFFHRITEQFQLETTFRTSEVNFDWSSLCKLDHGILCHIQLFLECLWGNWLHHASRQSVPLLKQPLPWRNSFWCPPWSFPGAVWDYVLSSCCWLPQRRSWPPPYYDLLSGNSGEQ